MINRDESVASSRMTEVCVCVSVCVKDVENE